jgi:predicted dehydrogenase
MRRLRSFACAPDTFLGAGVQTARKLIDDGWIGKPIAGCAFLMNHGPEHWHPSPEFYYAAGGGPLFDMGPYYLTALIELLGPITAVTGSASAASPERVITSAAKYGKHIPVTTPTHISALLDFASGAALTFVMSFDVWAHSLPHIEIYGTEGSLQLGDPNWFTSPVLVRRLRDGQWHEAPLFAPADPRCSERLANNNWRGIGLTDMASAIAEGRPHRASGSRALHVLEIMTRILESALSGNRLTITPPEPQPPENRNGQ